MQALNASTKRKHKTQTLMGATRLEAAEKSQGTIILLLFLCSITEL